MLNGYSMDTSLRYPDSSGEMKVSVVIPTFNRRKELVECLDSVYNQSCRPLEILIINNGPTDISDIIKEKRSQFSTLDIPLLYFDNQQDNSITVAKNIGIKNSRGDLISFLDDDMTIDIDYYREIVKVFTEKPNALGVTGYNQECRSETRRMDIFLGRMDFVTSYIDSDRMVFRPSLTVSYPDFHLNRVINCQWLSGASCFRRKVLSEIPPDENLKKYSWNEDQDLSYRIYKKYPESLFLTPFARYWHRGSPTGRPQKKEVVFMGAVYDRYLFRKNLEQTMKNKMIFSCGQIFKILYSTFMNGISTTRLKELPLKIQAVAYCVKHKDEILRGDLAFFNQTLK